MASKVQEVLAPRAARMGRWAALVALGITGCVVAPTGGGSRKYTVLYEVTGTYAECTVFYITRRDDVGPDDENQGGQVLEEVVSLPWSVTFDVTVTQLHPFNAQVDVVCSGEADDTVRASLSIDGQERAVEEASGQNVDASAGTTLEVSG